MKRFLSLALVAIMLLSTLMLTSCDPIGQITGFINGLIVKDGEVPPSITLYQWTSCNEITNFTLTINEGDGYGATLLVSESAAKIDLKLGDYLSQNIIVDLDNDCLIRNSCVGYLGYCGIGYIDPEELTLHSIAQFTKEDFEKLVYDAENKCHYIDENGTRGYFYFENGKLVRLSIAILEDDGTSFEYATVSNIGTTVVDIPEYTLVNDNKIDPSTAGEDVRTTVTSEDLLNHLDLTNLTVNAALYDYGMMVEVSLKVAENGAELSAYADGETVNQYFTFVDDVLYSIEPLGNRHFATSMDVTGSEISEAIAELDISQVMDLLVYNEEGRYYELEIEGLKFYLYFENGQLVKAVFMSNEHFDIGSSAPGSAAPMSTATAEEINYLEMIIVVSDIGTTTVDIPEYTFSDDLIVIE